MPPDRAYELNPDYVHGVIEQFLITYESARQGAKGDFVTRSKEHFDRAVALTAGQLASPFVAYAETVTIQKQNEAEFESLLKRALAVDPEARPEWRWPTLLCNHLALLPSGPLTRNLKTGHYKKIGMEKRKPTAGKGDGLGC